jgi:organic radical activating enzyme
MILDLNGYEKDTGSWVCRKDGEWWVLFDENSGNRVILSFEDNPKHFKPATPMLIDFKISDYCPISCNYCYQGSTANGKHIERDNVRRILYDIKDAQVFEIALGGGEPTMCPEFLSIVEGLHYSGIKVNFTTKSMEWLENPIMVNRIMPLIGSFAFSVSNQYEIDRIVTILKYHNIGLNKFTVQLIPGACSTYAMESILKKCHQHDIRVTLLGFKETGRGMEYKTKYSKSFDESNWMNVIKKVNAEHKCPLIAIDTTLAARYEKELKESGIPEWLYHIQEGRYSAYIDGVQMKFGPSSYHLDKLIPYESSIEEMFDKIEEV